MPFIPPDPDLSKLPPAIRERVYREHRAFLEQQAADCGEMARYTWLLIVAAIGGVALGVLAVVESVI
jgi:hypothetical protein